MFNAIGNTSSTVRSENNRIKEWTTKGLIIAARCKNELSKKIKKTYSKYKNTQIL